MTTAIEKYKPTEAALADLESRYKGIVFDVTLPKGMQEALAINDARGALRTFRSTYGYCEEFYGIIKAIDGYFDFIGEV